MAKTVNDAFGEFLRDTVNLEPDETTRARSSRNWLVGKLRTFPEQLGDFPLSYSGQDIYFGSFERRTKRRELDDIDLISCMSAEGAHYYASLLGPGLSISVPDGARLRAYCNDGTTDLNSRKVVSRFVRALRDIPQYQKADIGRNGEAAVLNLSSYPWSFDIVPGFFSKPEIDGRTYYVIPDGRGMWKKTDPRVDRDRVVSVTAAHSSRVLDVIRVMKFWNGRPTMPSIESYLLECIVLAYYEVPFRATTDYVDLEVLPVLRWISSAVMQSVPDPKGLQGDLNTSPFSDKLAVSQRAIDDAAKVEAARAAESDGDHMSAINWWRGVFGEGFPAYG